MEQPTLTVDLGAYVEKVTRQRNTALDEAAKWQTLAEQLLEENKGLREENERLRATD